MPQFDDPRNQFACASLENTMFDKRLDDSLGSQEWARQPIRLNPSLSQEGIAASLRRAFGAGHSTPRSDRDFEELLAKLS